MKPRELLLKAEAWLDQLNARERKLVQVGSALVVPLIVWMLLIEPAWTSLQQAPATQAALVDKAGQVMLAAQELEAIRSARSRVVVPESDLEARLQQLLVEVGIAEQGKLQRAEEGDIRVEFSQVAASGFLAWLARAEAISSLTLAQTEMAKTEAGVLSGHVVLLPGGPGTARKTP